MIALPVDPGLTHELRRSTLRPGSTDPRPDYGPPGAVHLAVRAPAGDVLSTCFLHPDPCPWHPARAAWHLRQMATVESARNTGAGRAVLTAALEVVRRHGGELLWCNARETAVSFYLRCGFEAHGTVFTDARHTVPHLRMAVQVRATAAGDSGCAGR